MYAVQQQGHKMAHDVMQRLNLAPVSLYFLAKLYLYRYSFFMGVWKQLAEYLYLRKPDPNRPKSQWVKYMHGINRISLLLFIMALIILAVKLLTKK